jgi:hypothetical protein
MTSIDTALTALRSSGMPAPDGLENAVWDRIAAKREARADTALTLKMQVAVAGLALIVGVAFGQAALPIAAEAPGTNYSETLVLSDDASLTPSMKL